MVRRKKPSVHTVPIGKRWKVVQGGKTISHHNKKSNAQMAGRQQAKQAKTEHRIHNKNGRISKAHSYGNDPHPPNG